VVGHHFNGAQKPTFSSFIGTSGLVPIINF